MKQTKTGINLIEDFKQYNGFYKSPGMREIIYNLYKGECQCCGKNIPLISDMDVGHRVPQSHADVFSQYFPELDIHNLLNLQPEHSSCNRGKRNNYIFNPNLLQASMDYSSRIVIERLPKISGIKTKINSLNPNELGKKANIDMTKYQKNIPEFLKSVINDDYYIFDYDKMSEDIKNHYSGVHEYKIMEIIENGFIDNGSQEILVFTVSKNKIFGMGGMSRPHDTKENSETLFDKVHSFTFGDGSKKVRTRIKEQKEENGREQFIVVHKTGLDIKNIEMLHYTDEEEELLDLNDFINLQPKDTLGKIYILDAEKVHLFEKLEIEFFYYKDFARQAYGKTGSQIYDVFTKTKRKIPDGIYVDKEYYQKTVAKHRREFNKKYSEYLKNKIIESTELRQTM